MDCSHSRSRNSGGPKKLMSLGCPAALQHTPLRTCRIPRRVPTHMFRHIHVCRHVHVCRMPRRLPRHVQTSLSCIKIATGNVKSAQCVRAGCTSGTSNLQLVFTCFLTETMSCFLAPAREHEQALALAVLPMTPSSVPVMTFLSDSVPRVPHGPLTGSR